MKSQLIPISFIFLIVGLMITGFIFYNLFYGIKYEEKITEIRILDAARTVIENVKNYLKLSLVYSISQSTRENAASGGSIGAAPWICNGPNPLPIETSKSCLESYTEYYLTIYAGKFNTTLPLNVFVKNFSSIVYQIEESGVLKGIYDGGDFWVNATDAIVSVSRENLRVSEGLNISEYVTKNRFWYMFRIFYEWASQDPFSPCICSNIGCACSSNSGEEFCSSCLQASESCAEYALRILQSKFDEYVKCEKENICCRQGIGPPCLEPSGCLSWGNRCSQRCDHRCIPPDSSSYTQASYSTQEPYQSNVYVQNYETSTILSSYSKNDNNCYAYYWHEARFSTAYIFTCKDYKYYISSPKGPKPLTFSVSVYAYFRDQDACKSLVRCECETSDDSNCEKCRPIGPACTKCFKLQ